MKRSRLALSIIVLLITVVTFGYYLAHHPNAFKKLGDINPLYIVMILPLYFFFTLFLSIATRISVNLAGKEIGPMESFKLTSSSSLANFFGPLQSGPGVRALYLKKKHEVSIKKYGLATLYYYGFYAVFSGLFLLSGDRRWRIPLALLTIVGAVVVGYVLKNKAAKLEGKTSMLRPDLLTKLALVTLLQLSCTVIIYFIELNSLGVHASLAQALSYSGAANFALFVSLTPGAIGFREAFLVFSQQLHHIHNSTIVTANILDRAIYVVFLGLLFVWLGVTHAKNQINLAKLRNEVKND